MDHSLNECDVVAKRSFVYTSLGQQNIIEEGDKTKINFYCPVYKHSEIMFSNCLKVVS